MASNKQELQTAIFEDGTCAVLRADGTKPGSLEVIATFQNAARARDYVRLENNTADKHHEVRPAVKRASAGKRRQASKAEPAQASAAKPRGAVEAKSKLASEAKPKTVPTDVSDRQTAVLTALRSMMDKKRLVEVRGGDLAKASSIPSGSLHSVLMSLEKKGMIRTKRQGSAKFRAIYEVLETSRKSARTLNGVVHGKEPQAKAVAH
jgi:DNA-binding MarR family transcriptional regulator